MKGHSESCRAETGDRCGHIGLEGAGAEHARTTRVRTNAPAAGVPRNAAPGSRQTRWRLNLAADDESSSSQQSADMEGRPNSSLSAAEASST